MSENGIKNIMDSTMGNLRGMIDADTIIGSPLTVGEVTLYPVSKVAFGMASGGSDFPSKSQSGLFGGGGGAGVTITPVAFIAVSGANVRMLPIYSDMTTLDKAINMAPEIIDKVKEMFDKKTEIPIE